MPSNKLPKVIVLLVVLPPPSMCAEDTLCDAAGFEQHKAEQHRVAHRAADGPDGVAAGGNPLDKHGVDCHAHQNEQSLESHGKQGLDVVLPHAAQLPVGEGRHRDGG